MASVFQVCPLEGVAIVFQVLCVHLKRFYFRAFSRTKINTMVHFPLHGLDLSPYTSSSSKDSSSRRRTRIVYDLAAIVVHHGSG